MTEPAPTEPKDAQRVTLRSKARDAPPSTQLVVLGWCLWLAGAWGVSILFDSPVPAARWLLVTAVVGLMLIWPAARLSEGGGQDRGRGTSVSMPAVLVEWLCLVLVFQAVVWPLRLISDWRMDQTAWLDGAVVAWSLLTAAVVAVGTQFRGTVPRTVAMALCALLVVGEPLVLALAGRMGGEALAWEMRLTPLPTIWALAHPIAEVSLAPWPGRIITAAAAALAGWLVVAIMMALGERRTGE